MHYMCDNFEDYVTNYEKELRQLSVSNMKYLLGHDKLKAASEHVVARAVWNYGKSHGAKQLNYLITEIRLGFLSDVDLYTIARDHKPIRGSNYFRGLFKSEFFRRICGNPLTDRPRAHYSAQLSQYQNIDHFEKFLDWMLEAEHHKGYEEKLQEVKKQLDE